MSMNDDEEIAYTLVAFAFCIALICFIGFVTILATILK